MQHHESVGSNRDAILEAVRVCGICPGFGLEECGARTPPIDSCVHIVVGRLKAQAVCAYTAASIWRYLSAADSA
ncbi:MAG TPA: hypothetical protein VN948_24100 [Terriglobales bacterium]|nr:hypothetical protein [Terriglobales bacterium]